MRNLLRARILSLLACSALVGVLGAACGDDETNPDSSETDPTKPFEVAPIGDPVSATIGATGGTLTSADGHLTLEVPEGALSGDTTIGIQQIAVDDGWGWSLTPHGTAFQVPVVARLTFSPEEVGQPTEALEGDVRTITHAGLVGYHLGDAAAPAEPLEPIPEWAPGATSTTFTVELAHFSETVFKRTGDYVWQFPAQVSLGETFEVSVSRQTASFQNTAAALYCPKNDPPFRIIQDSLRWRLVDISPFPSFSFQPVGATYPFTTDATEGSVGRMTCVKPGGVLDLRASIELERNGGADFPPGCPKPSLLVRGLFPVLCTGECAGADPVDVSTMPGGEPALDLVCARTGIAPAMMSLPWVQVSHQGTWLPSADYYSWYSKVTIHDEIGVIGSVTREHHDGVDKLIYDGDVNAGNAIWVQTTFGYVVFFTPELGTPTTFAVESGIQKTPDGPFVQDAIAQSHFDATAREP